jgi:caa(3)-type oxidase subunit IV
MEERAQHRSGIGIYFGIFIALGVLTGVEVFAATSAPQQAPPLLLLIVLALIKAALVVLFFMHVREDTKWFAFIFIFPLLLASLLMFFTAGFQSYYIY